MNVMEVIQRIRNLKNIRRTHVEKPAELCKFCLGACVCAACVHIRKGLIARLEQELLDHADDNQLAAVARSYAKDWP